MNCSNHKTVEMAFDEPFPVFFGIETSDYDDDCDILQIYMKCGEYKFNKYINPTKLISTEMSKVNHLTVCDSKLFRDAVEKRTSPLRIVLKDLLTFLKQFGKPCTLISHRYCWNNSAKLIRAMKKEKFEMKFNNVIAGFTDTLDLFRAKFPDKDPKEMTIFKLAKETSLQSEHTFQTGRSIKDNTDLLEQLVFHHFTRTELVVKRKFSEELNKLARRAAAANQKIGGKEKQKIQQSSRVRKGDKKWEYL